MGHIFLADVAVSIGNELTEFGTFNNVDRLDYPSEIVQSPTKTSLNY